MACSQESSDLPPQSPDTEKESLTQFDISSRALSDTSSDSSSDMLDNLDGFMKETAVQECENWIQATEMKQKLYSSMDLVLKSIEKLQVDCREKTTIAASSSSEQSDELQSSFVETLELVRKADQEIKQHLEENENKAMLMIRKTIESIVGTDDDEISNELNYFKRPFTPTDLEFQRNVMQVVRQNEEISTDDFCTWIEVAFSFLYVSGDFL